MNTAIRGENGGGKKEDFQLAYARCDPEASLRRAGCFLKDRGHQSEWHLNTQDTRPSFDLKDFFF